MRPELIITIVAAGVSTLAAVFLIARLMARRREKADLALSCSCRTHATVCSVVRAGGRRWNVVLDYYDAKGMRYVKSVYGVRFAREVKPNQIVELYFNPADPAGPVSLPADTSLAHDYGFLAVVTAVTYVCGMTFLLWAYAGRFWSHVFYG